MYSAQGMKQMPTASMAFSNRSRSSSKCEISVPSASPLGFPPGSVIGWRGGGGERGRGVVLRVRHRMRVYARGDTGLRRRVRRAWWSVRRGRRRYSISGRRLWRALLFQQFFRAHFAFQLFGELAGHDARAPHPVADLAGNFRQALRPEYHERYGRREKDFREAEIKHAASHVRLGGYLGVRFVRGRGGGGWWGTRCGKR